MDTEEEIFEAAAALPVRERPAFLDNVCAGQPELRGRLEALLRSHDATGFMEGGTAVSPGDSRSSTHVPVEQSGERIGRYRLLQQIGEGGFGTVWMAEQVEPVTRRVALKIIKAGMDTKEVIARFEAERQALAMMDHPNIARVFDAGATDKGRPFFVMELVKGIPITKFCDEQQFTTRQRLELFADVCSAINHAHQKGIIHRDIKPSNVMVTLNADRPVVKVIDFGIAKATQGKLTDRTLFTRFEQFLGTPAYMSPEQAAISELDIDTRSDIYALGVLLYELLTGKPPFDAKTLVSAGYEEMRRIIREVEPPKPSTRVRELLTASTAAQHAGKSELRNPKSEIEPDLDWIVMKAIEKDRTRRYETANGLALDIQRFLADEPVSAGPPTAGYRFSKFARRHKAAFRMAAFVSIVLPTATGVSIWLAVRATEAEKAAKLEAKRANDAARLTAYAEDYPVAAMRFHGMEIDRSEPFELRRNKFQLRVKQDIFNLRLSVRGWSDYTTVLACFSLADFHLRQQQWDEGARLLRDLKMHHPDNTVLLYGVCVREAWAGKQDAYLVTCRRLLDAPVEATAWAYHFKLLASCLLPNSDSQLVQRALGLAQSANVIADVESGKGIDSPDILPSSNFYDCQTAVGMAKLREGKYAEAITLFSPDASDFNHSLKATAQVYRAMCLYHLGRGKEASELWAEIEKKAPEVNSHGFDKVDPIPNLIFSLAYREAADLIKAGK